MRSDLRHEGNRRTASNLRRTMLASGVVMFALGLYFFVTVTCVRSGRPRSPGAESVTRTPGTILRPWGSCPGCALFYWPVLSS